MQNKILIMFLSIIFLTVYAFLALDSKIIVIQPIDHFYLEIISVILASILVYYYFIRSAAFTDSFSFVLGLGLIATIIMDSLHAYTALMYATSTFVSHFVPQTWVFARIITSSTFLIALTIYEKNLILKKISKKMIPYMIAGTLLTVITVFFISIKIQFPFLTINGFVTRPYELIPTGISIITIFLFYKKGLHNSDDVFLKGIPLFLLVSAFTTLIISYSVSIFDTSFTFSHILKIISYFILIVVVSSSSIQHYKIKNKISVNLAQKTDELNKSNEELKKYSKLQTEFINIASHELRTPIQPILSYLELIEKKLIDKDSALSIITVEAKRLQKLANDILDVSRIESGTLSISFAKVRINELIRNLSSSIRSNLKEGVLLSVDLDQSNNLTIDADETRMSQVLRNILGNSIKFTNQGEIQIKTNMSDDKSQLDIAISDTGGGIPQEIIPRLFEKFASKSVKETTQHGTGLGLFISKAIVESHGGKISGYNNDKGGATFVVSIPTKKR